MKRAIVLLALLVPTAVRAEAPEIIVAGTVDVRLRLEVVVDGKSAEAPWDAFLDRFFEHLDRDRDNSLSPAEAARAFPLPLPGRRQVAMNFASADTNRDGKVSRAEFKEFYRRFGFTPVVVVALSPSAESLRLGAALFRHLDRDGDGKLSRKELADAPELLRRLDENEDERLTPVEVLAGHTSKDPPSVTKEYIRLVPFDPRSPPDAVLHLALGRGAAMPKLTATRGKAIRELAPARLTLPGAVWVADDDAGGPVADLPTTRAFLLAQFDNLCGDRTSVTRTEVQEDDTARALAALFDHADRDGDGKLTRAELDDFLGLVEQGSQCQAIVTIADRGRNLFEVLDEDRDGRLTLPELKRATTLLTKDRGSLRLDDVPRLALFGITRGLASDSFGSVPLARKVRRAIRPLPAARGPRWFRAMDRNGDGFVSLQEFLGPPEVFRRLDLDGDGLISVEEADRADRAAGH
jgi:Ca2+-binding EF-hand superfamily protein